MSRAEFAPGFPPLQGNFGKQARLHFERSLVFQGTGRGSCILGGLDHGIEFGKHLVLSSRQLDVHLLQFEIEFTDVGTGGNRFCQVSFEIGLREVSHGRKILGQLSRIREKWLAVGSAQEK